MSNPFRSPVEIADALVEALAAASWEPDEGDPEAAFGRVERFHAADLPEALERLLTSEPRVAVVVPTGSRWETMERAQGLGPVCRRVVNVVVIVSDRRIGNPDAAVYGSAENPGCIELGEIAIGVCSGNLFGSDGADQVFCTPVDDEVGLVSREGETKPGRAMVTASFDGYTSWQAMA